MRKRLGEAHWAAFVRYAEAEHKAAFFAAFTPATGSLRCEGRLGGGPCPRQVQVDLRSALVCGAGLQGLHLDHTHDVKRICAVWSKALPERPSSWDDGLCDPLLAHLLFGTEDHPLSQCSPIWRKQVAFRCGDVRGAAGQRADDFCHDVASAHYEQCLRVEDIRGSVARFVDLNEDAGDEPGERGQEDGCSASAAAPSAGAPADAPVDAPPADTPPAVAWVDLTAESLCGRAAVPVGETCIDLCSQESWIDLCSEDGPEEAASHRSDWPCLTRVCSVSSDEA